MSLPQFFSLNFDIDKHISGVLEFRLKSFFLYSLTLIAGCKNSVIPDDGSVTSIGDFAFYECRGLTSIEIPDSVTRIGGYAFMDCSGLKSVTIGSGVTRIGRWAFYGCRGLESIVVAEGNSFYHGKNNCLIETDSRILIVGCKNSVIPDDGSVTSIGEGAFEGCWGLTSITIPDSVTSIGRSAFNGCIGLTSVTIPDSVTSIGQNAFFNCWGELKTVYYKGSAEEWGNVSIDWNNDDLTSATRYYFTEDKLTAKQWASHKYWWHYDPATNKPTPWVKDQ